MQFLQKFIKSPVLNQTTNFVKAPLPIVSLCNVPCFYKNSKQKDHVIWKDELKPFTMNHIRDNPGAFTKKQILGRGPGSGRGKTSTRGHKGQHSRSGGTVPAYFEGGQTRLSRRLPKLGMTRRNRQRYVYVNLEKIIDFIRRGRLDASKTITIKDLFMNKVFKRARYGVKILARGADDLDFPLHLEVSDASETAINAIKEKGGSVKCIHRTRLTLKEHMKPHLFPLTLQTPIPTFKQVKKLHAIEKRGATVEFQQPEWYSEAKGEEKLIKQRMSIDEFEYPIKRYEGMGKDTIRKRKPKLVRHIDLDLAN